MNMIDIGSNNKNGPAQEDTKGAVIGKEKESMPVLSGLNPH
jgi:hypothetical protein